MKIICEISVHNRLAPHLKPRSQQSTLALGYHPPGARKDAENLFLIHFSGTNKAGTRYKIKRNIEKVFTKFVQDGKTTLSMKQPPHDLQIRCDSVQLKAFLKTLKLALEGKFEGNQSGLSSLAVTAVPKKSVPPKTMTILTPSDYPIKGLPRSLVTLNVNGIRKQSIDSQMLALFNLRILNLSNNSICHLPKRLGDLGLTQLDLSNNCLGQSEAKDWDWLKNRTIAESLQNLNLSDNQLTFFPYNIVKLQKLFTLSFKGNQLTRIPFAIRRLKCLRSLNLADNQIISLPNVLTRMSFDKVDVSGEQMFSVPSLPAQEFVGRPNDILLQPAELWQLAAQIVISKKLKYGPFDLPTTVIDSLEEYPICDCGKVCKPLNIHLCTNQIRIRAAQLVQSYNSKPIYGDSVYCSEYCRSYYQKNHFVR